MRAKRFHQQCKPAALVALILGAFMATATNSSTGSQADDEQIIAGSTRSTRQP